MQWNRFCKFDVKVKLLTLCFRAMILQNFDKFYICKRFLMRGKKVSLKIKFEAAYQHIIYQPKLNFKFRDFQRTYGKR